MLDLRRSLVTLAGHVNETFPSLGSVSQIPGECNNCRWMCDFDGECAQVNTSRERQKGKNIASNPKISLLIVDPDNIARFMEIRGEAELVEEDALEHLDQITRQYTHHPQYYGYVFPFEKKERGTRVICRIHATKITLDAIHK